MISSRSRLALSSLALVCSAAATRPAHAQSAGGVVSVGEISPDDSAPVNPDAPFGHVQAQGTSVLLNAGTEQARPLAIGCTVRSATALGTQLYVACDGGVIRTYGINADHNATLVAERRTNAEVRSLFVLNNRVWAEYARVEAQPIENFPLATGGVAGGVVPSGPNARPGTAPVVDDTEATNARGRVVEVHGTVVVVSLGRNQGLRANQHVEIGDTSETDDSRALATTVVGEVREVGPSRSEVEIGFGERVQVGERVRVTARPITASLVAPQRGAPYIAIGGSVRVIIPIGALGVGSLDDLWAEWHATAPFALRARFFPAGFLYVGSGSYYGNGVRGVFGFSAEALFDSRYFAIGLGLGAMPYNNTSCSIYPCTYASTYGFAVTQALRVGAVDGLNLTAQTEILVANGSFQFGGADGSIQIPLTRAWALLIRGGGSAAVHGYAEIGMRIATQGNGRGGTLFVTPSLGWAGMTVGSYSFASGPTAGVGLEYRVGL